MRLDGEALDGSSLDIAAERLDGAILQLGKRRFKRFAARPSRAVRHRPLGTGEHVRRRALTRVRAVAMVDDPSMDFKKSYRELGRA